MNKPPLLISACLLGVPCRYDGASKPCAAIELLAERFVLVPVCPEQLGGLPTPRIPAEQSNGCVITRDGRDVTDNYLRGANEALRIARIVGCKTALLKAKSPSCGCGRIYDGTHTGLLIDGDGITAELLKANGIDVYTETGMDPLLNCSPFVRQYGILKNEWGVILCPKECRTRGIHQNSRDT